MWAPKFLSLLWVLWLHTPYRKGPHQIPRDWTWDAPSDQEKQMWGQLWPVTPAYWPFADPWRLSQLTTLQKSTMVTAFSEHKIRPSGPKGMAGTIGKKNRSCDFFEMLEVKMASLLPGYWKCLFGRVNSVKGFNGRCPSLPHVENIVGFFHGWLSLFFFCSISLCSKVFFGRRGSS